MPRKIWQPGCAAAFLVRLRARPNFNRILKPCEHGLEIVSAEIIETLFQILFLAEKVVCISIFGNKFG
jgi:hypothetical protein